MNRNQLIALITQILEKVAEDVDTNTFLTVREEILANVDIYAGTVNHVEAGAFGHPRLTPLLGSVVPAWIQTVSYQQQSVLLLALRGPDGIRKYHPAKVVHIAYRGTMLRAAERQRFLYVGEEADSFMSLDVIKEEHLWRSALREFFSHVDELPHHYVAHLAHAAQIIACKCPEPILAQRWGMFYAKWCDDLHVPPESEEEMDTRLGDWGTAKARLKANGWVA